MSPFKALIIGCGDIAGGYDTAQSSEVLTHAKAILAHPNLELHSCIDPDHRAREAFAEKWGAEFVFPDWESYQAVPEARCDVVSICSPTAHHAEWLERILVDCPAAVLCEKPLTSCVETSESLIDRFDRAGIPLGVNYMRRWCPAIRHLSERIRGGEWGELQNGQVWYTKGLFNNGSHAIDLLRMMFGNLIADAPPFEVLKDGADDDPTVSAIVRTTNGVPLTLIGCDRNFFTIFEINLVMELGTISLDDGGYRIAERKIQESSRYPSYSVPADSTCYSSGLERVMSEVIANLHAAAQHGTPFLCSAREALATQALCSTLSSQITGS
jgi:predicted dehydrogenase